jgi:hypothetical protein
MSRMRALTENEVAIMEALLGGPVPGIGALRVVGGCGCGCPTIHFDDRLDGIELVADAEVDGADGDLILLFTANGSPTSLEYVWAGDEPPKDWPEAGRLIDPGVR